MKLFEAHIRYYIFEVARIFEFTGCKIEFTSSPYSILDGSMVHIRIYGNLDGIDSNLDDVAPSNIESGGYSIRSFSYTNSYADVFFHFETPCK